jgi:O-6-methylguanine DNA methyltransferase
MYYKTNYSSPLGAVTIAADEKNIIGLWFDGQKYYGGDNLSVNDNLSIFADVKNWLDRYFNGGKPLISELPLAPAGSEFRRAVWDILCAIPYGECTTYGDIAKKIGAPMSAQAVGGAVGHNPISIIIPCHRVIGADGSLTGYAGGIDKKAALLRHEGREGRGRF